jgi:hypothetical protein
MSNLTEAPEGFQRTQRFPMMMMMGCLRPAATKVRSAVSVAALVDHADNFGARRQDSRDRLLRCRLIPGEDALMPYLRRYLRNRNIKDSA